MKGECSGCNQTDFLQFLQRSSSLNLETNLETLQYPLDFLNRGPAKRYLSLTLGLVISLEHLTD